MSTIRAFVAVPVGDGARRALANATGLLRATVRGREVRWVRPQTYHVTLCFLGEIDAARVVPLRAALHLALSESKPFAMRLGALQAFPSPRRPRVIAATLEPEASVVALAERVQAAAAEVGFEGEARQFRAHLTLGRLRDRTYPTLPEEPLAAAPFDVTEVVLFRSELRSDGARHTPVERVPLGGPELANPKPEIQKLEGEVHGEERPNP